jgi:hypothetical protein
MIDSFFNLLLCSHRKLTFPLTKRNENRTYVVCLGCGKEFPYNWEQLRIERPGKDRSALRSALAYGAPFGPGSVLDRHDRTEPGPEGAPSESRVFKGVA